MQKKIIGALIISLVINLIFTLVITGGAIDIKDKTSQIKILASKNATLNQKVSQYDAKNKADTLLDTQNTQNIKSNIGNFVNAEFNYTNANYKSRLEDVKKYVTNDIYNALKGTGEIEAPKTKIQDEVTNLNVYLTTDDNVTIKALINITTVYSIIGVRGTAINQIYELELTQQGKDKWIITKYTLMGNFSPYSTNN